MKSYLQLMSEFASFSVAVSSEYWRSGLVCFPPAWSYKLRRSPYGFYEMLRERSPVHRSSLAGGFVISRGCDVINVLQDKRFTCDATMSSAWQRRDEVFTDVRPLILDHGSSHAKHRKQLAQELQYHSLDLEDSLNCLVDSLPRSEPIDIVSRFVRPLIRKFVYQYLGVPKCCETSFDSVLVEGLAFAFHYGERVLRFPRIMSRDIQRIQKLRSVLRNLLPKLFEENGRESCGGLIGSMRQSLNSLKLDPEVAFMLTEGVLSAIFEPVLYAISNTIYLLAKHPGSFTEINSSPALLSNSVREALRLESPVQAIFRYASCDVLIRDKLVRQGENVVLLLGSANRDPEFFAQSNSWMPCRLERVRLTYGIGEHYCLGARLADQIVMSVISCLRSKFSRVALISNPNWTSSLPLRGCTNLMLRLD